LYVLDTNTVSYYLKGQGRIAERLLAAAPTDVVLPAVVVYELLHGAGRAQAPRALRRGLDMLLGTVGCLPFGEAEARTAARIRLDLEAVGAPIGPVDVLIAATALAHRGVLVTRNTRGFGRVESLRLENWY
jgi:tRNA(fMet)-specific endonuclease VapC